MQPEQNLVVSILDYLTSNGFFVWQNYSHGVYDQKLGIWRKRKSRYALKGASDIFGVLPNGKLLAIEVKIPKNSNGLTEDQKRFINKVMLNKGVAFKATSIQEVIDHLRSHGYKLNSLSYEHSTHLPTKPYSLQGECKKTPSRTNNES